jgi:LacI family transcriptional regulator
MDGLLASSDRPTAVVAGGNQILTGVLAGIHQARLRIPQDLSLVTCDEVALAEFLQPPLATVSRDTLEIGQVAAELLLERLGGRSARSVTLPTTFRPAHSCAPPT